jgi:predicted nucleotidyltransferase
MINPTNKRELLEHLCKEFEIDILYAFGSRSKEVNHFFREETDLSLSDSDIDIGVKPIRGRKLTVKEKALIALRLEEILKVRRIDLIILPEADPFLAAEIVRGERLFSTDEAGADEYDLYILRRAGDQIPLERERERLIFGEEG